MFSAWGYLHLPSEAEWILSEFCWRHLPISLHRWNPHDKNWHVGKQASKGVAQRRAKGPGAQAGLGKKITQQSIQLDAVVTFILFKNVFLLESISPMLNLHFVHIVSLVQKALLVVPITTKCNATFYKCSIRPSNTIK